MCQFRGVTFEVGFSSKDPIFREVLRIPDCPNGLFVITVKYFLLESKKAICFVINNTLLGREICIGIYILVFMTSKTIPA